MRTALSAIALIALVLPWAAENWDNPPGNLPAGAEHHTFMSASMKTAVGYNIYLPPGYAADKATRWPVLYFLHGRGGTESSHTGAFAQFDQAIKDKKIPPFIYVHAMCGRNSGYVDAIDGSIMGETVFIKELIPHIDATYRTFATARNCNRDPACTDRRSGC